MLSILITSYDYNCLAFVTELHRQAEKFPVPTEILVAGGGNFVMENRQISNLKGAKFIEVDEPGRAYLCSCLVRSARYERLIFIGCDAAIIHSDFLKRYLVNYRNKNEVLCGGFAYDKPMPSPLFSLNWNYGARRKERTHLFSSFNFLIDKSVYTKLFLDKNLPWINYNMPVHDLLMGDLLQENGIEIRRIDNNLYRLNLLKNDDYLKEIRANIEQLAPFLDQVKTESHLLHLYKKSKLNYTIYFVPILSKLFGKYIERNLLGPRPHLGFFYFYELAYLCEVIRQK